MKKFEQLEHTADVKFRVFGKDLKEVFENSALAVSDYLSRSEKVKDSKKKSFKVEGKDLKELLYKFLDELIYLLDAKGFLVSRVEIDIKNNSLKCVAYGEDASKYEGLNHIKSATYADMIINDKKAEFVMDV